MEKNCSVSADAFFQATEKAMHEANFAALDEHRRMGRSVPVLRDGKIVWIGPEEIGALLEQRSIRPEGTRNSTVLPKGNKW